MRAAVNLIALILALAVAVAAGLGGTVRDGVETTQRRQVVDASGAVLDGAPARTVASLSILSDRLLIHLIEGDRFRATSRWSSGDWTLALPAVPRLEGAKEVEDLLRLDADLVIVAGGVDDHVRRLRERGQQVYCIGDLDGWATCERVIADLATLLDIEDRGQALLRRNRARLDVLALAAPKDAEAALCATVHDTRIFGGTVGTAYHDILRLAGCRDVAADRFRGWPTWTMEDLYALDPAIIVMGEGGAAALRRLPGAEHLRGRIIELPRDAFDDPGLGMLDAAELLRANLR